MPVRRMHQLVDALKGARRVPRSPLRRLRRDRLRSELRWEKVACPGEVLDPTVDVRERSGFARSYAGTGSVLSQWSRTKPGGAPGTRPRRETAASRRCRKGRVGGGRLTTTRRIRQKTACFACGQPKRTLTKGSARKLVGRGRLELPTTGSKVHTLHH